VEPLVIAKTAVTKSGRFPEVIRDRKGATKGAKRNENCPPNLIAGRAADSGREGARSGYLAVSTDWGRQNR